MSLEKVTSISFYILGALLCICAIIAGGISLTALAERAQHGRGIMFADAEFFALAALAFLLFGLLLLFIARKFSKHAPIDSLHRSARKAETP